ncbi:MAG: HD domain-containing protein [Pyrinomonadaceae bacterium]|nr:HD domain-containing protein [Pyrinomonadaceae bacterium]
MPSQPIDFKYKQIMDCVHGVIGLSELETRIINEVEIFSRLRNIKQLGLAHFVFPSADYSRFSHSLGVCHITGKILETLRNNGAKISDKEIQMYRLAGLLHDIGHYPFSHATEHALKDNYTNRRLIKDKGTSDPVNESKEEASKSPYTHERLGKEILERDEKLKELIGTYGKGIKVSDIHEIFNKTKELRFTKVVSSDLDADRIDYLLRTSYHTGLPYGNVDIDYIVGQMRIDKNNLICLTSKAMRSADHMFLGRFFDYQQVPFNKTVVALEWLLKDIITELVNSEKIDGTRDTIEKMIENKAWANFDDSYVIERVKQLESETTNEVIKQKCQAILHRIPPKLVAISESIERLGEDEEKSKEEFGNKLQLINDKLNNWSSEFKIDKSLWHVWKRQLRLTADGSRKPLASHELNRKDLVRIQTSDGGSEPIVDMRNSLMHTISNYGFFSLRIYVIVPQDRPELRDLISERIKKDLPYIIK